MADVKAADVESKQLMLEPKLPMFGLKQPMFKFDIGHLRLLASAAFDPTQAQCRAMTEYCRSNEAITSVHNSNDPFNVNIPLIGFPRIRVLLS